MANTVGPLFEKGQVEQLMNEAGRALNANAGRCPVIESVLCKTTTLCVELLNHFDEAEVEMQRHREAERDEPFTEDNEQDYIGRERPQCACVYCFCTQDVQTDGETCHDCLVHAHQG